MSVEPIGAPPPDPRVVAFCRDLLAKAESGELQGVAVAGQYHNASIGSGFIGRLSKSLVGELFHLTMQVNGEVER